LEPEAGFVLTPDGAGGFGLDPEVGFPLGAGVCNTVLQPGHWTLAPSDPVGIIRRFWHLGQAMVVFSDMGSSPVVREITEDTYSSLFTVNRPDQHGQNSRLRA
jgi:hypothetical protein